MVIPIYVDKKIQNLEIPSDLTAKFEYDNRCFDYLKFTLYYPEHKNDNKISDENVLVEKCYGNVPKPIPSGRYVKVFKHGMKYHRFWGPYYYDVRFDLENIYENVFSEYLEIRFSNYDALLITKYKTNKDWDAGDGKFAEPQKLKNQLKNMYDRNSKHKKGINYSIAKIVYSDKIGTSLISQSIFKIIENKDDVKFIEEALNLYRNIEKNRRILISKEFKNKAKQLSKKTSKDVININ